jgi:hypothetical protein
MLIVRRPALGAAGASDTPITTAIASAAVAVNDLIRSEGITVEIQGITTGTVKVQSSIDGAVWTTEGADLTADGRRTITTDNVGFVRALVTVATSVSVKVVVAGRAERGYSQSAH